MNPIRRKSFGIPSVSISTGKVILNKSWYAVCPICNEKVRGRTEYYYTSYLNTNTRKTAKDALHYHMRTKHKN
jgi:hypothetical protein